MTYIRNHHLHHLSRHYQLYEFGAPRVYVSVTRDTTVRMGLGGCLRGASRAFYTTMFADRAVSARAAVTLRAARMTPD